MLRIDDLHAALGPLRMSNHEVRQLAAAIGRRTRPAIRLRPEADSHQFPFAVTSVPWHPRAYLITEDSRPGAQLEYAAGDYYIQDAGSLLAVTLLNVEPGELVCDLCASPGGKATALLEDLGSSGWLLANEAVRSRLGALQFNLARHGSTRFLVSQLDPERLALALGPCFDAVLVDAPCTGQSLVARSKQSLSSFRAHQIQHSAARQARILDSAARLVRPGGRLVYTTCTFSHAENEAQVERLRQYDFAWRIDPEPSLDAWQSSVLAGSYRLWPHRDGCGGAFAARLRRDTANVDRRAATNVADDAGIFPCKLTAEFENWGTLQTSQIYGTDHQRFAWPEAVNRQLLAVARSGPEVVFRKSTTWFPAYALAMRRDVRWRPHCVADLDEQTAKEYLAGRPVPHQHKGWMVAAWNNRPLGWLKGDGRRAKNHLPKPARLIG